MGIFDFLLGGEKKKVQKYIEKKDVRKLAQYLKGEDESLKKTALDALVSLAKSETLPPEDQEGVLELLDPVMALSQQIAVDKLDDAYEIRKIAVNDYFNKGNFKAALYALKRALDIKPGDISLMNNLAAVYSRMEDFEKAREVWEEILQKKTGEPTAVENYSTALWIRARKFFEEDKESLQGEEHLLRILELNPAHINSLSSLADIYMKRREYDKAIEHYRECLNNSHFPSGNISANEYRGRVNRNLGDCYASLAQKEDAVAYYRQALRVYKWDETDETVIKETMERLESGAPPPEPRVEAPAQQESPG